MKSIFVRYVPALLMILLISFTLTSCGDDDEGSTSANNTALVGTWQLTESGYKNCDDPDDNASSTMECTDEYCLKITFSSNGTGTTEVIFMGDSEVGQGSYTVSGNTLSLCDTDGCEDYTFSVSGNTLTINESAESDGCVYYMVLKK